MRSRWLKRGLIVGLLVVFSLLIIVPFYWLIVSSLRPKADLFGAATLVPPQFTLDNYRRLFQETATPHFFLNSLIVSLGSVAVTNVVAVHTSFALSRFRFRGRDLISRLILVAYMFPTMLVVIPLFIIIARYGWSDSLVTLVIVYQIITLPFSVWLMNAFFADLPRELEDAALVDGAGRMQAFYHVLLPLALPGIVAVALFSFVVAWNEYLFALIFILSEENKTLPLGIAGFLGQHVTQWDLLLAGGVISALPAIAFFMLLQKFLIRGMTAGALKG